MSRAHFKLFHFVTCQDLVAISRLICCLCVSNGGRKLMQSPVPFLKTVYDELKAGS